MPSHLDDSAAVRLISATVELLATCGTRGITAAAVCDVAGEGPQTLVRHFGTIEGVIGAVNEQLCSEAVFPQPRPLDSDASTLGVLSYLASAHCQYVDQRPERFAAILQLTSAAIFTMPQLGGPLAARNRLARRTVAAHLLPLRTRRKIDPRIDIAGLASAFVDTATGIEMCFLIDGNQTTRDIAYHAAAQCFAAQA